MEVIGCIDLSWETTLKINSLSHPWSDFTTSITTTISQRSKVKVGVLRPVQQPGSYWDRSSELPLVGLEPTEVTAYYYISKMG